MAFYEMFESLCVENGITPTQAARDNGINQSVVAMWKKRGSIPNAQTLVQLAEYFHTTPAYLMGNPMAKNPKNIEAGGPVEVGPRVFDSSKGGEPIDPTTRALLEAVGEMSESEMRVALAMIKQLIAERAETAPESTPAPTEGKDTTPPPDAPETPLEGE